MGSVGRPRSLTEQAAERVLQLYADGEGYRSITRILRRFGISTHYSSVRRCVKGLPPYD